MRRRAELERRGFAFAGVAVVLVLLQLVPLALAATDFVKLADPATTPGSRVDSISWAPASDYVVTGGLSSPFVNVYQVSGSGSGTTLTKLADPSTLPGGAVKVVDWDPSGGYFIAASGTTPFALRYQVTGTTVTKCANPATLPTGTAFGAQMSPNGAYAAFAVNGAPNAIVYSVSGCTMTKLADPATTPNALCTFAEWSADSQYVAFGCDSSSTDRVYVYQLSGSGASTTLTRLTNPVTPSSSVLSLSWSWDSTTLAIGGASSATQSDYAFGVSGSTLSSLTMPATYKSSFTSVNWSSDGHVLYVADNTGSPGTFGFAATRSGSSLVADTLSPGVTATGTAVSWAPNPAYVAVLQISGSGATCGTSENLRVYQKASTTLTAISSSSDPCPSPKGPPVATETGYNLAWSPAGTTVVLSTGAVSPYIYAYTTQLGVNSFPPGAFTLTGSVVGGGPGGYTSVLTWTTPAGPPAVQGYNLTRVDEWGSRVVYHLGVVNAYSEPATSGNRTWNVTAWNGVGESTSNNVTLRIPPVPLFGSSGALFGGSEATAAQAWGVSTLSLEVLYGTLFVVFFAAAGFAFFQLPGALVGALAGFLVAIGAGLLPLWVVFLVVMLSAAGVVLVMRFRGGG